MIRPKNDNEILTCPTCRRPEWIRPIAYSLQTEAEYFQRFGERIEVLPDLPKFFEMMDAGCGSEISKCVREAAEYCADYNVKGVGFEFNGKLVLVTANSNVKDVVNQWYKTVYGKTEEEAFKER